MHFITFNGFKTNSFMNNNYYCIIMAGGVGSRFWPLSSEKYPKQFIDILGTGKTLLQETYERFLPLCSKEKIYVVTNQDYEEIVTEQLPDIEPGQVLTEPLRKNTAPCIAYATYKIKAVDPDATLIVAPSDHLILKEETFINTIKTGVQFAENTDSLLTLGIRPNRPETNYGYIQINNDVSFKDNKNLKKVKTFTEKPNYDLARVFYESGEFYWNSGIFIWTVHSILEAFDNHLSDVNALFKKGLAFYNTEKEDDFIEKTYPECKNISIDYGIMEKASNVYVLCSEFGWSDLGTWDALYEQFNKDKSGNALLSKNVLVYDSKNCIINVADEKLAVIQGLENYIVVEANDTLLICKKEDEEDVKKFVNDVRLSFGDKYL